MLSEKEKDQIRKKNRKNDYFLYKTELAQMNQNHKNARAVGDRHTMEAIEYRLTDINFHDECGLMIEGKYDEVEKSLKDW